MTGTHTPTLRGYRTEREFIVHFLLLAVQQKHNNQVRQAHSVEEAVKLFIGVSFYFVVFILGMMQTHPGNKHGSDEVTSDGDWPVSMATEPRPPPPPPPAPASTSPWKLKAQGDQINPAGRNGSVVRLEEEQEEQTGPSLSSKHRVRTCGLPTPT